MGVTKQYLRYAQHSVFNVIGSSRGGGVYIGKDRVAVAAVASVTLWDLRTSERLLSLQPSGTARKLEVTCLAANHDGSLLAVGYSDGTVRLFSPASGEEEVVFTGHKSAVTCLAFDPAGLRLVSGSRDCSLIVWDVVAECGLARLAGHKGPVTAVRFMRERGVVLSASKDSTVRFWELATQHCFHTLTGHLSEVWGLQLVNQERQLVTGGADSELRVWQLDWRGEGDGAVRPEGKKMKPTEDGEAEETEEEDGGELRVTRLGSVLRKGEGRVAGLVADAGSRVLACHGTDNTLELFVICTEEEVARRMAKKAKKERKRTGEEAEAGSSPQPSLQEMVRRLPAFRAGGKVRGLDLRLEGEEVRAVLVLGNNMVEQVKAGLGGQEEAVSGGRLERPGHRSDVRCLAFSSDNTAVATGSSEAVKVWNRASRACVRTLPSGYCLALAFCPGDRHLAVGTKAGAVELFSLASGERTETVEAHTGEVWALVLAPDQRSFLTGGADKTVKFWDFELVAQEGSQVKLLSAIHRRTFSVDEGVTALACSPDSRYFAVALLDSTVKVFFMDSLKFFHNLYGHKLPVVSLDISGDSTLLVTGSADRNMKIWGLDFGDTHKSIFAHDDTVTGVRWLPDTHHIMSTGKDGEVKLWDGDTFARIQTLSGHVGEVWAGGVSPNGKWLASCGKDRSVRVWERTQEPLVLEDERETEREEAAEAEAGERAAVPGEEGAQLLPSRRTAATERGAEALLEALQLYAGVEESGDATSLPPLMLAYGADSALDFMLGAVLRLKSSELEETLLVLPLDAVQQLVRVLARLLRAGSEVEVVARALLFLLEIHHGPLVASGALEPVLAEVQASLDREVGGLRDRIGFNLAGLRHLADRLEEAKGVEMFTDATTRVREKNKKKKGKEKSLQRAVMAL